MYKGVNNRIFLLNNLSSVTFKWLSRMLAVKLAQVSPFLDYICSHFLTREVGIRGISSVFGKHAPTYCFFCPSLDNAEGPIRATWKEGKDTTHS